MRWSSKSVRISWWLRGGELFKIEEQSELVILPCNGPQHGLPPHLGAVCADLLDETKSDRTRVADCVVAYKSLSGLCLGDWVLRILQFAPQDALHLFSTANYPTWNSYIFRERFAYPLLERQRLGGEPTLQMFSDIPGHRIRDSVTSIHSWRSGGRSRVSRDARHNEPQHPLSRQATSLEVYEHGRWRKRGKQESMSIHYNQWSLTDRIAITLLCM
jgi:hypothetical protein